jgi:hypothetical protein
MEDRPEALRRSIAAYRSLLAEGAPSDVVRTYLIEIAKAEVELIGIDKNNEKSFSPSCAITKIWLYRKKTSTTQ